MPYRITRRDFLQGAVASGAMSLADSSLHEARKMSVCEFPAKGPLRRFPYVHVDVFTSQPLQGNQLGVFVDAHGLGEQEMQALARETRLTETTFVFSRESTVEKERGILVRIFTPQEELPFAGHPTLGTAIVLRNFRRGKVPAELILDLKVGRIPVRFYEEAGDGVRAEMQQIDPKFGETHDPADVAQLIGVKVDEIAPQAPIQTISTGLPFVIVPLKRLQTIRSLELHWKRIAEYFDKHRAEKFTEFYFVTQETESDTATLHARGIYSDIGEDPATGSAAGCTGAWLVRHGVAKPDEEIVIEQGIEIQRPSRIFVRAGISDGRVVNVRVAGHTVEVLHGEFVV